MSSPGLAGAVLVGTGAVLLASKGLFAKALYDLGLTHHEVAAIRAVLAVPGFCLIALIYSRRGRPQTNRFTVGNILATCGAGLLCYYLGSLANFFALTLIQANVERALLFSYPAIVVALQAILSRHLPSITTMLALVATTGGIFLVTGAADGDLSAAEWVGVGWVIFCSSTIAIYFLVSGKITNELGSAYFTAIAMTTSGGAFFIHYQWFGAGWLALPQSPEVWMTMLALVIVATVVPLLCIAEGVRRIGAQRAALISTLGPPATAWMAYELYGEILSHSQIVGTLTIIAGVAFIEIKAQRGA